MHFWDASAIVPLCLEEDRSESLRALAAVEGVVTWCLSRVEVKSAIERRRREGALESDDRERALWNISNLFESWTEIADVKATRDRAWRLLAVHPLRAADALQLAAALVAAEDRPERHTFVSADTRLRTAAEREGFSLLK